MLFLKKYFLCAVLLAPFFSEAQEKGEELLTWNTKRLDWSDYKGKPDPNSDAAASTATYLGIEYNVKNENISYKVSCYFSKNKSWGLAKTEYILSHEQGHFDIAEVFARKLNKRMKEYKLRRNTYKDDLEKIYNSILDEKERTQNLYDQETNYSRNKEQQAKWLKKIEKMLEELEDHSDYL
jgi:hypothetical protein